VKLFFGLRAAIFFLAGIFITFSADHGYLIGQQLLTFVLGGLAVAGFVLIALKKEIARADLMLVILAFLVTVGSFFTISASEASLYFLVSLWGMGAGAIELFAMRPLGFKTRAGQERFLSGLFSVAIGALLLAPLDVVSAVGFLGAYFAVSGVHWGIAAGTPQAK
jgi:hypothetical protein